MQNDQPSRICACIKLFHDMSGMKTASSLHRESLGKIDWNSSTVTVDKQHLKWGVVLDLSELLMSSTDVLCTNGRQHRYTGC